MGMNDNGSTLNMRTFHLFVSSVKFWGTERSSVVDCLTLLRVRLPDVTVPGCERRLEDKLN